MCFSIRPTEVKRFRTVLRCDVDLSLRVLASLRNRPHRPFHDGIRRTKWNNLQGVLCAHEAQGTAHAPNSPRPSSREGQLSASTRNRKLLLLVRLSRGFAIASPHADDPPPNRTDWRKPESQIARKPTTNTPFLANSTTSAPPFRYTVQRLSRSSRTTAKLAAARTESRVDVLHRQ